MQSLSLSNQTVGDILKEKRQVLGLKLSTIEQELKIKEKYLAYLESNRFQAFESKVQAKGFLKNYAQFLGLNHEMMVALYRRDFENKDMKRKIEIEEENEELELKKESIFSNIVIKKKHITIFTLLLIVLFTTLLIVNILQRTFSKPELILFEPFEISGSYEGKIAYEENDIILKGQIEKGSSILINSIPISVNSEYRFESNTIPTTDEETLITVTTENSLGAKTEMNLTLYKPDNKIESFSAFISAELYVEYMIVKSDGIVRYEGGFLPGEPLDITALETIEIETPDFQDLEVQIIDEIYTLDTEYSVFRNTTREIIKE